MLKLLADSENGRGQKVDRGRNTLPSYKLYEDENGNGRVAGGDWMRKKLTKTSGCLSRFGSSGIHLLIINHPPKALH